MEKTAQKSRESRATPLDELVRAGSLLSRELHFRDLIAVLVEQALDISHSDLGALYLFAGDGEESEPMKLAFRRGRYEVPSQIEGRSELIQFLRECGEAVVLREMTGRRESHPFREILLHPEMTSGLVLPVFTPQAQLGALFMNSRHPRFYNRNRFHFLDSFTKLASGQLHNARLYREMQEYLKKIEELQRYQENIFSSMTNLIVTTDPAGQIHYFNKAAAEALGLDETCLDKGFDQIFRKSLSKKTQNAVKAVMETKKEALGIEGIYKTPDREMDYSLNISPLLTRRGKQEGLTLLFTDQTRERELKAKVEVAVEERRAIKDMFGRYMSQEVVRSLMEFPERVKPGGDKKNATVFFADIRGYTSFSEGREPEYIIDILNEYFSEAVERVVTSGGYIDKFIGDCIMAVWGVPLVSEVTDAINAVTCALEIQELVRSKTRNFWQKEAAKLKVGIGINTGPLVAGNLGSNRRMDYSVIGDTVNLAARLEGVAEADEVIITQTTRDYLGDLFKLEKRAPVRVKGKAEPIQIYNVLKRVG